MSRSALLALTLAVSACSSTSDTCATADQVWTDCTGAVPAGFADACAANPALADQVTAQTCDGLKMLSADGKADGGSLFSGWDTPQQPNNFSEVSDGIYRGAHIMTESKLKFLTEAPREVKTLLDLEIYNPEEEWEEALAGMNHVAWIQKGFRWNITYSAEFIDDILATIDDPANHPIYVHCYYGDDRTGMIIALYRVVYENWAPVDAFHEWKAHMPGANRCAGFAELNGMFNRKVSSLAQATGDARYDFQIDTPNCASQ
jgi:protein-tyrosine phosphatase